MDAGRTVVVPREAGVELAVWVADASGSDEAAGLPVLLLHGLSQQRWFWGPVQGRMRSAPVAAVDQRGHGDCDTPTDADYSVRACAADAIAVLDALGWDRAVIVGHSWGASVALAAGAAHPDRAAAVALIDGGLWALGALGPRDQIRDQLTPPPLDLPPDRLWALIRAGDLGPTWSAETQSALAPTFTTNSDGALVSRLGLERHMRVLDGLLDYDPEPDLASCSAAGTPVWAVVCAPEGGVAPLWSDARSAGVAAADRMGVRVHRWGGAVHDVPLQWPALVAGFVDALAETVGSRTDGRPGSKGREGR
jgi:pimeloyl-ACP methyl ester carboxylesterase